MKDQLYDKLLLSVLNCSGLFCIASHFSLHLYSLNLGILILACNSLTRDAYRGVIHWDYSVVY